MGIGLWRGPGPVGRQLALIIKRGTTARSLMWLATPSLGWLLATPLLLLATLVTQWRGLAPLLMLPVKACILRLLAVPKHLGGTARVTERRPRHLLLYP